MAEAIRGRRYRHKKGGRYEVLELGKHSETQEDMVVYRSLDHGTVWVRPRAMFEDEGRFDLVDEPDGPEERRERVLLDYMIERGREIDRYLLDDPPLTEEQMEERRRLAEALDPGGEMPPPPEEVTEGIIDRAHLLTWLEAEACAVDLRVGCAPSRPGNALRTAASWIRTAYRPEEG